jgi:hypothetical protein
MKEKKQTKKVLTREEAELIERLRQRPVMMERLQKIVGLVENENGPLKTADQIEELLVEEMRRLGGEAMGNWAVGAEKRLSDELRRQDPTVLSRKKKR